MTVVSQYQINRLVFVMEVQCKHWEAGRGGVSSLQFDGCNALLVGRRKVMSPKHYLLSTKHHGATSVFCLGLNGTATVRNEVRVRVWGGVESGWTASDDSSEGLVVTIRTTSITLNNSTFCPHGVFMFCVDLGGRRGIKKIQH
jgi:hypothetical protein